MHSTVIGGAMLPHAPQFFTLPDTEDKALVAHVREVAADVGKRLRAFVVLGEGRELGIDEVKDFVKDNLARYKAPRDVIFLDELPRNPTGKILKRELAERPD